MNDKNYSDWLIVSDIDGTLNNKQRKTPRVNTVAIDEFVHNKGGHFTLASARGVQSLEPHYKNLPDVGTPAIVLNGAGIYDFKTEKMLWFNSIPDSCYNVIESAMNKFHHLEIGIFTEDMIYLVRPRVLSPVMMALDSLTHKKVKSISDVHVGNWGKVIFFCLPWMKAKVRDYVKSISDESLGYIDTTPYSFDMVNVTTNKGTAVLKLAQLIGIEKTNIGAIGDYYNDLDMLKTVPHPACPEQAPEDIKDICEYVACHCNSGAVADFINYIYKTY